MAGVGYWYYRGKIYELENDVHIGFILDNPEIFGYTKDDLKDIYKAHGEKFRSEGQAREKIIRDAISNGWIRVRHYLTPKDYWSIQYFDFARQKRALHDMIESFVLDKGVMSQNDEVVFTGFGDESRHHYSFMNGGIKAFMQERAIPKDRKKIIEYYDDQPQFKHAILKESGLSRLLTHMTEHDCGLITASKGSYTHKENEHRNLRLSAQLSLMGYKLTEVAGVYIEDYGQPNAKEVRENSFFVVDTKDLGKLKEDLFTMGVKFKQDSVLFIPSEKPPRSILIGTNEETNAWPGYKEELVFHSRTLGRSGEFMTKVKGRPFIFESVVREIQEPDTMMGKWARKAMAKE